MIPVYLFILFYSVSRFHDLSFLGFSCGYTCLQLLSYPFIHLSFFHLAVNSAGYLMYSPVAVRYYGRKRTAFVNTASVLLSSVLCCSEKPTFGASALIFSLIGMYLFSIWKEGHSGRRRYTVLLVVTILLQSVAGRDTVNWKIHISSLLMAFMFSFLCTFRQTPTSKKC